MELKPDDFNSWLFKSPAAALASRPFSEWIASLYPGRQVTTDADGYAVDGVRTRWSPWAAEMWDMQ